MHRHTPKLSLLPIQFVPIKEDGVAVLVKLIKEGTDDGQEAAAAALGLLCRDEDSLHKLLHSGVCPVFAAALKEPPMRVQAAVTDAIASLARHSHKCQDLFAQSNALPSPRRTPPVLAPAALPPPLPARAPARPPRDLAGPAEAELPRCSPCAAASP
jgi:hypothetical protein